jgi:drug/metabolite transporter (DMT)-like permease
MYPPIPYQPVAQNESGGEDTPNPPRMKNPSFFTQFPQAEYKSEVARKVFPLSLIFVGMITFNNLCLKWVEVSFYNVARSLTIVFNVFFSWCLLGQSSSCQTILCLGVVILGFLMGSWGEINFSFRGTVAGVLSSLFVSLNAIFTKKVRGIYLYLHGSVEQFCGNIAFVVHDTLLFLHRFLHFIDPGPSRSRR